MLLADTLLVGSGELTHKRCSGMHAARIQIGNKGHGERAFFAFCRPPMICAQQAPHTLRKDGEDLEVFEAELLLLCVTLLVMVHLLQQLCVEKNALLLPAAPPTPLSLSPLTAPRLPLLARKVRRN